MGVDYHVEPLAWGLARDGGARLRKHGATFPEGVADGRFPTYQEARSALAVVEGWRVQGSQSPGGSRWVLRIKAGDRHATLEADDQFKGSRPGVPAFYFYRGWPCLVVEVLERLARVCGPFVVVSPGAVAVVTVGTEPGQAWVALFDPDELP
jgi:hypothetical protein